MFKQPINQIKLKTKLNAEQMNRQANNVLDTFTCTSTGTRKYKTQQIEHTN